MVLHSQNSAVNAKQQDMRMRMNIAYHTAFLHNNNLKFYRSTNGYFLTDRDNNVLMSFVENTSSTSTSMRISIHKQPTLKFALKVEYYFGGIYPPEITNFELKELLCEEVYD